MLDTLLDTAISAAHCGAEVLKQYWGKLSDIHTKASRSDLSTEADRLSEKAIGEYLRTHYPDYGLLGEEAGTSATPSDDEYLWVIDPLDGTTNYAHNYPVCAISIALLHHHLPLVGVIYNPFSRELFTAKKGGGAFLNGQPLRVSSTPTLDASLLATGFPYNRLTHPNNYPEFCHLTDLTQGVRRNGSASLDLACVAAGRFDGYWERGIHAWDIAAGVLLVDEAGGQISNYALQPLDLFSGYILATNRLLHSQLSAALLDTRALDKFKKN